MNLWRKILKWYRNPPFVKRVWDIAMKCYIYGNECISKGDFEGATCYYTRAATLYASHSFRLNYINRGEFDSPAIRLILITIARAFVDEEDYSTAYKTYSVLLYDIDSNCKKHSPFKADVYVDMAYLFWEQNKYIKSIECYQKALPIYKRNYGEKNRKYAMCCEGLARCMCCVEEYGQAARYGEKAVELYKIVYGDVYERLEKCYENLPFIYNMMGEVDKAAHYAVKKRDMERALEEYDVFNLEFK